MTFNESCIAIENYSGNVTNEINNILGNMYAIESQFNMGIAFEAEGADKSLGQKLKEKVKAIGTWIAEAFRKVAKFFSNIFNSVTGRNKKAYNKSLVKTQVNFINTLTKKVIKDTQNASTSEKANESFLFIATEAKTDKTKKMNQKIENKVEKNKKTIDSIGEKFKIKVPSSVYLRKGLPADMTIAEAATEYKKAYADSKKVIEDSFRALHKASASSDVKKATTLFKRLSMLMSLHSAIMSLMRTSKVVGGEEELSGGNSTLRLEDKGGNSGSTLRLEDKSGGRISAKNQKLLEDKSSKFTMRDSDSNKKSDRRARISSKLSKILDADPSYRGILGDADEDYDYDFDFDFDEF